MYSVNQGHWEWVWPPGLKKKKKWGPAPSKYNGQAQQESLCRDGGRGAGLCRKAGPAPRSATSHGRRGGGARSAGVGVPLAHEVPPRRCWDWPWCWPWRKSWPVWSSSSTHWLKSSSQWAIWRQGWPGRRRDGAAAEWGRGTIALASLWQT